MKQTTTDKIISLLDKLEVEEVLKTYYAVRDYLGTRIEAKTKELASQQTELQSHVDKINK